MSIEVVRRDNYHSVVSSDGIVLVDFWAAWCGACKVFEPVYIDAAQRHDAHAEQFAVVRHRGRS